MGALKYGNELLRDPQARHSLTDRTSTNLQRDSIGSIRQASTDHRRLARAQRQSGPRQSRAARHRTVAFRSASIGAVDQEISRLPIDGIHRQHVALRGCVNHALDVHAAEGYSQLSLPQSRCDNHEQPMVQPDEVATEIDAEIDRRRSVLSELALRIHAAPELRFEEHKAAQWIGDAVESATGIRVDRGVGG